MQIGEIYEKLTLIFYDVFQRRDIVLTPELTAEDVAGWNSFQQVEIILGVEESFHITLGSRDVDDLENVGDLVAVIAAKVGAHS